jgi:hypothetical protein
VVDNKLLLQLELSILVVFLWRRRLVRSAVNFSGKHWRVPNWISTPHQRSIWDPQCLQPSTLNQLLLGRQGDPLEISLHPSVGIDDRFSISSSFDQYLSPTWIPLWSYPRFIWWRRHHMELGRDCKRESENVQCSPFSSIKAAKHSMNVVQLPHPSAQSCISIWNPSQLSLSLLSAFFQKWTTASGPMLFNQGIPVCLLLRLLAPPRKQ